MEMNGRPLDRGNRETTQISVGDMLASAFQQDERYVVTKNKQGETQVFNKEICNIGKYEQSPVYCDVRFADDVCLKFKNGGRIIDFHPDIHVHVSEEEIPSLADIILSGLNLDSKLKGKIMEVLIKKNSHAPETLLSCCASTQ